MQKIKLPKNRIKGLYIYCNGCKTAYSNDSKIKCNCKLYFYKAKVHVPGTKRECRTKLLSATNYKDAIIQKIEFEKELVNNNFIKKDILNKTETAKPYYLIDCMDTYMNFLNGENVLEIERKDISRATKTGFLRFFKLLLTSIERLKLKSEKFKFEDLNKEVVNELSEYINELSYRNKSYNNVMTSLSTFCNYISKNYYPTFVNPFYGIRKNVQIKVISINMNEFKNTLNAVLPENGIMLLGKNKKRVNVYRPWMKNAFLIALFAGGRNEEISKLQWNKITLDEEGEMHFIEIPDFKVSRRKGPIKTEEDYKIKRIVITSEFRELLISMGYHDKKNTEEYIIAPEEPRTRDGIKRLISNSFSHFFKVSGNQSIKTLKHLRKTYATAAKRDYGNQANVITDHDGMGVINKHYANEEELLKYAQKNFSVFGKDFDWKELQNGKKSTRNDENQSENSKN